MLCTFERVYSEFYLHHSFIRNDDCRLRKMIKKRKNVSKKRIVAAFFVILGNISPTGETCKEYIFSVKVQVTAGLTISFSFWFLESM